MSDWVNLAIGAAIIALNALGILAGVWIGAVGELTPLGTAALTASIVGVGLLVVALGIQIPTTTATRTPTRADVRGREHEAEP